MEVEARVHSVSCVFLEVPPLVSLLYLVDGPWNARTVCEKADTQPSHWSSTSGVGFEGKQLT